MNSLRQNWKVYTMEALCLGIFMISASFFGTILEYPGSVIRQSLPDDFLRLVCMGLAMGATATLINYSPMGKLSGAHMNPAVTFTFYRLNKIKWTDAVFYSLFQCIGGIVSVILMRILLGDSFSDSHVNYVITTPGKPGVMVAFFTEICIAFGMMTMVLVTSNNVKLSKYTGAIAGVLVACYVVVSAPISGFSMNPARTIASALPAMQYRSFWIYMTAPFIGMFSAAAFYQYFHGVVHCAKMCHSGLYKCIFNCGYCKHIGVGEPPKEFSTNV
jgi:aquaporin Z